MTQLVECVVLSCVIYESIVGSSRFQASQTYDALLEIDVLIRYSSGKEGCDHLSPSHATVQLRIQFTSWHHEEECVVHSEEVFSFVISCPPSFVDHCALDISFPSM